MKYRNTDISVCSSILPLPSSLYLCVFPHPFLSALPSLFLHTSMSIADECSLGAVGVWTIHEGGPRLRRRCDMEGSSPEGEHPGDPIHVTMLRPGPVTELKREILEREEPSSDTGLAVLGLRHPLQRRVVGDQSEVGAQ